MPKALVATTTVDLAGHEAPLRLGARVARQAGVVGEHRRAELLRQARRQACRTPRACPRRRSRAARPAPAAPRRCRGAPPPWSRTGRPRTRGSGGRSPVATRTGSRRPSRATMSSATCGVAVAVEATMACGAEPARGVGQPEVVRPEVVAPLGDAVRLVDHEEADPRLADALEEPGRGEPLGRDVEQPRAPGHRAVDRRAVRRRVLLRVDERDLAGRDALERLHLVLHQRDERRDHQREVGPHQRGQLVAERLARARRHDDEHVAPGHAPPRPPRAGRGGSRGSRTPRAAPPPAPSPARTARGGSGPRPGSAGAMSGSVTSGHGRTTIDPGPVAIAGRAKSARSGRHEGRVHETRAGREAADGRPRGRAAGRGQRCASAPQARSSGSSNASLVCASPVSASGYSPEKHASQCASRVPPIAS